jgi:putative transposase
VGPICAALGFPSSTYYAAKHRENVPSDRGRADEVLKEKIMAVWDQPGPGNRIYGARKIWVELNAAGVRVARCTVERLMRELGIAGVGTPAKKPRTTVPAAAAGYPADLLERDFDAERPNERWVADITYVATASGWCYISVTWNHSACRHVCTGLGTVASPQATGDGGLAGDGCYCSAGQVACAGAA